VHELLLLLFKEQQLELDLINKRKCQGQEWAFLLELINSKQWQEVTLQALRDSQMPLWVIHLLKS